MHNIYSLYYYKHLNHKYVNTHIIAWNTMHYHFIFAVMILLNIVEIIIFVSKKIVPAKLKTTISINSWMK